jgi:hypothetical protein
MFLTRRIKKQRIDNRSEYHKQNQDFLALRCWRPFGVTVAHDRPIKNAGAVSSINFSVPATIYRSMTGF